MSLLFTFTLGSIGKEGRNFLSDLRQGKGSSFRDALIGGVIFNAANILLVAALWGVFIWKEFSQAPSGTNSILFLMFTSFVIGLSLVVYAGVKTNK